MTIEWAIGKVIEYVQIYLKDPHNKMSECQRKKIFSQQWAYKCIMERLNDGRPYGEPKIIIERFIEDMEDLTLRLPPSHPYHIDYVIAADIGQNILDYLCDKYF